MLRSIPATSSQPLVLWQVLPHRPRPLREHSPHGTEQVWPARGPGVCRGVQLGHVPAGHQPHLATVPHSPLAQPRDPMPGPTWATEGPTSGLPCPNIFHAHVILSSKDPLGMNRRGFDALFGRFGPSLAYVGVFWPQEDQSGPSEQCPPPRPGVCPDLRPRDTESGPTCGLPAACCLLLFPRNGSSPKTLPRICNPSFGRLVSLPILVLCRYEQAVVHHIQALRAYLPQARLVWKDITAVHR